VLSGFGDIGQRRLAAAHIAIVGAGGLGSPAVLALAAAGVGILTVIDDDDIELSNLQRQVMHRRRDIGASKAESAARAASELSDTAVRPIRERLTPMNAVTLLSGADVVIDGSDLFETRSAVAGATEHLGVPLVWGAVQEFHAQVTVFWSAPPGRPGVRLSDLHPPGASAPACADVGVLGALCPQVGSIMALEAIKLVAGIGEPLIGRVLVIDALRSQQHEVQLRAAEAPVARPYDPPATIATVGLSALENARIIDVREAHEVAHGMIPGARHIPLADLLADPGAVTGPVVVVCETAIRSRRAAEALREAGVEAMILAGGMASWNASRSHR
jgi:adenylyltransferase/sulfurtransferase